LRPGCPLSSRAPVLRVWAGDSEACGFDAGLDWVRDAELAEDRGDVVVDGLLRYEQPVGDFAVAQPTGEKGQDLELAWSEAGGIRARGCSVATGNVERAAFAELACENRRGRLGA
jgi:hypothetical protein